MTEPEPYVPTSEELEKGRVRRHRSRVGDAAATAAEVVDDVHSFELKVEASVDRRARRRR
jgi:hypothetical protein